MSYPAHVWFDKIWKECEELIPEIKIGETEKWFKLFSLKTNRVFVWLKVGKNVISLYLPIPLDMDRDLLPAKTSGSWGKFESRYRLDALEKIPKAIDLILKAYKYDQSI